MTSSVSRPNSDLAETVRGEYRKAGGYQHAMDDGQGPWTEFDAALSELAALASRAEQAEREQAILERTSQANANAHMLEFRMRKAAEARVAALEAALREIALGYDGDEFQDPSDAAERYQDIARAVLAAAPGDEKT